MAGQSPFDDMACDAGRPRVALIAGPTASGKSALALRLAETCNGVIINADASQVYADLAILSARPTAEDCARAPHRLFGYLDGAEACSAARWAGDATRAIAEAHSNGLLPILVGGTGLYIRTLLDGIAPVPPIAPDIRDAVRALPVAEAYAALQREDAVSARRVHPADTTRIARALEIVRSTARPVAHWQAERTGGIGDRIDLHPLIMLPDRAWLYQRCDARFATMIAAGAVHEVQALLARDLPPTLPVMRAIGVAPIAAWLAGDIDEAAMHHRGRLDTRRYAKRQYTWFRNQCPQDWGRASEMQYDFEVDNLAIKLRS